MTRRIVGLSDVAIDYGSPEVTALFHDICVVANCAGLLIEPDEHDRPPVIRQPKRAFELCRLQSKLKSHSIAWRREYIYNAAKLINQQKPDILFLFGGVTVPVVNFLRNRPRCIVYHAYEQIADLAAEDITSHRQYIEKFDLVTTPNIHRLLFDCKTMDVWPEDIVTMYNAADVYYPEPTHTLPAGERNGRFLWMGTLDRKRTFADYFYSDRLAGFQLDVVGRVTDPQAEELTIRLKNCANIRFWGLVPPEILNRMRAKAAFSLVWWNPHNSYGHLHLASNRFFVSLAAGVPPVCGPHPQCIQIAERFDCAIIMKDWTLGALVEAMETALSMYGTPAYFELVKRCLLAAEHELSWRSQSDRVVSNLVGRNLLQAGVS